MTPPYSITVSMNQATVSALQSSGSSLYGFKAVSTSISGGAPVVWLQSRYLSPSTVVSWSQTYQAYTSKSQIVAYGQIMVAAAYNVSLGQTLQVTNPAGTGQVTSGGTPSAISILNQTTTQLTCGISQLNGITNTATPVCALPLYGNLLGVITPVERVLLELTTAPMNLGTVVYQASSQAILVDLTVEAQVAVTFDINLGWSAGGNPAVTMIAAGTSLAPLLIS